MFAVDFGKSWGLSKRFRKDAVHLWVAKSAAARGQGAGLSTTSKRGGFFRMCWSWRRLHLKTRRWGSRVETGAIYEKLMYIYIYIISKAFLFCAMLMNLVDDEWVFASKWDCVFRHQLQHHDEDIKQCWRFKPVAMYSARSMPRCASRRQRLRRNRLPTPLHLRMRLRKEQRILKIRVNLVLQFGNFKANAVSSAGSGGMFLSSSKDFVAILDPIFWVELQVGERSSKGREKRKGEGAPGKPSLFCIATLTRLSCSIANTQTFRQELWALAVPPASA